LNQSSRDPLLGVLGGMGPLATADFFAKLVALTPARRDDEHIPVLVCSVPQIPPRVPAILGDGRSPLPALLQSRDRLIAAGATLLAMPCNTAHHWYETLADCDVPFLHIADAAIGALRETIPAASTVGLVATPGTLVSGFYQRRLADTGLAPLEPSDDELRLCIVPAVASVKAGGIEHAGRLFGEAALALAARGADAVILACTEVPPALAAVGVPAGVRCVDATEALARACIGAWREAVYNESRSRVPRLDKSARSP